MKKADEEREKARVALLGMVKPGDTVYTIHRHTSASGMSRSISLVIDRGNGPEEITFWAARAMGDKIDQKNGGIKISGCGMDMGFALVYNLGYALFPQGFGEEGEMPLGHKVRPRTKEEAARAIEKGAKFRGRNGDPSGWDSDGGYALRHKWV